MVVQSPTPFWLGRNSCWPSRGSQLPRALFWNPFFAMLPSERPQKCSSFCKISRLSSLFSCLFHARLRLLILVLLLMSGNVHPNPGAIFPCSVRAENATWRGNSVQCCTCSKWVHLRCSLLSLSKFRTLGSSHSWSYPPLPCCTPACNTVTSSTVIPTVTPHCNAVTSPSDSSGIYTSTVPPGPPLLMQHSRPLAFKPLIPLLPILSLLPLISHHGFLLLVVLLRLLPPLLSSPLLPQGSSME